MCGHCLEPDAHESTCDRGDNCPTVGGLRRHVHCDVALTGYIRDEFPLPSNREEGGVRRWAYHEPKERRTIRRLQKRPHPRGESVGENLHHGDRRLVLLDDSHFASNDITSGTCPRRPAPVRLQRTRLNSAWRYDRLQPVGPSTASERHAYRVAAPVLHRGERQGRQFCVILPDDGDYTVMDSSDRAVWGRRALNTRSTMDPGAAAQASVERRPGSERRFSNLGRATIRSREGLTRVLLSWFAGTRPASLGKSWANAAPKWSSDALKTRPAGKNQRCPWRDSNPQPFA